MEPSKEVRSCATCIHVATKLNDAPAHCWDCSGTLSHPSWEPKEMSIPTPRRIVLKTPPTTPATPVMEKQVGGAHYKDKGVLMQPWAIIKAWGLGFHRGNVLKYLLRAPQKNGKQDIEKAIHYLEYILENYDELKASGLL